MTESIIGVKHLSNYCKISMNNPLPPEPDPHFGTDEQMLAWAKKENLDIVRTEDGHYDWAAVYEQW